MASSSLPTPPCTYDVFVSFRGEDTRTNFQDHLVTTLEQKKIRVYKDQKDLKRGKQIWIELEQAIKTSRMAVIVFSKNYATSEYCLKELVMIMDCSNSRCNQTFMVLPIFYHVSPSEVREQKGNFAEVLANGTEDMVKKWRKALMDASKLAGFHVIPDRSESNYIEQILESISKTLNGESLSAAPAGSESNVHREDSSAITPNIVDASLHQRTTKANKCAYSACSVCGIIVLCILGLCIFIVLLKTVLRSLVNM